MGIPGRQAEWAKGRGLQADSKGYVPSLDDNLFCALSEETRGDYDRGAGDELGWKMRAVHSSSALACNVFDYWRSTDPGAVGRALDVPVSVDSIRFEGQLPTGLSPTPPTLDLLLEAEGQAVAAVECKFAEPYSYKQAAVPFRVSYFRQGRSYWMEQGLPACQRLVEALRDGATRFTRLDAPQLLKHALGLRIASPTAELLLVWYDTGDAKADTLRGEITKFGELVDAALGFRAVTYQEAFQSLAREPRASAEYVSYLRSRYFAADSV